MTDLSALVAEALGGAVGAVVPLLLVGLSGSAIAGWLSARMGLTDPVAATVLRGLAVLAALVVWADGLAIDAQGLAQETWSELAAVGRAER